MFVTYIDNAMPSWERRLQLNENYYFYCQCSWCVDEAKRIVSTFLLETMTYNFQIFYLTFTLMVNKSDTLQNSFHLGSVRVNAFDDVFQYEICLSNLPKHNFSTKRHEFTFSPNL